MFHTAATPKRVDQRWSRQVQRGTWPVPVEALATESRPNAAMQKRLPRYVRLATNELPNPVAPWALRSQPGSGAGTACAKSHYVTCTSKPTIDESTCILTICATSKCMGNSAESVQQRMVQAMCLIALHLCGPAQRKVWPQTELQNFVVALILT